MFNVTPAILRVNCVSDLDLGNVLLFPIDDKQSRLDGQDQVGQRPPPVSSCFYFAVVPLLCWRFCAKYSSVYTSRRSPAAPCCLSAHLPLNGIMTLRGTPIGKWMKLLFVAVVFTMALKQNPSNFHRACVSMYECINGWMPIKYGY